MTSEILTKKHLSSL